MCCKYSHTTSTTFEEELDMLFAEAVGVKDTIWYSKTETLRDAILRTVQKGFVKEYIRRWKNGKN